MAAAMMPQWRQAWGKLGDALTELSEARELLEAKQDIGRRLRPYDYEDLTNELAEVERECHKLRNLLQDMRRERDKAAVRSR